MSLILPLQKEIKSIRQLFKYMINRILRWKRRFTYDCPEQPYPGMIKEDPIMQRVFDCLNPICNRECSPVPPPPSHRRSVKLNRMSLSWINRKTSGNSI